MGQKKSIHLTIAISFTKIDFFFIPESILIHKYIALF